MRLEPLRNQHQHLNLQWMQVHSIRHSQLIQVGLNLEHRASQLIRHFQPIQVGLSQHQRQNQSPLRLELMQF